MHALSLTVALGQQGVILGLLWAELLMLSAGWGDRGKAVCAQMNAPQSWLGSHTDNLPVTQHPLTSQRDVGLFCLCTVVWAEYLYCRTSVRNIWFHLYLFLEGWPFPLLPARPVSRSQKEIREVWCLLLRLSLHWMAVLVFQFNTTEVEALSEKQFLCILKSIKIFLPLSAEQ